jgi:hypothetical protein
MTRWLAIVIAPFALAAAHASAAELPNMKAAPQPKAQKCEIAGVAGVLLPGTETCVKISGGVGAEGIYVQRKTSNVENLGR